MIAPGPSIRVCVLGSGSRGNASLLEVRDASGRTGRWLVDCGFSPRETARRLVAVSDERAASPLGLTDIDGLLITHPDTDHLYPGWAAGSVRHEVPVHLHVRHRARAVHHGYDGRTMELFEGTFQPGVRAGAGAGPDLIVEPVHFAHDQLGSVGFIFECQGVRFGWATDLGRVPIDLDDRFRGLHGLAIESNYDPGMQTSSNRPEFLKRRIMGGDGHLSNAQSVEAVRRVAPTSPLRHVVLLHLSQQCNDPGIVDGVWRTAMPHLHERVQITRQDRPASWVEVNAGDLDAGAAGIGPVAEAEIEARGPRPPAVRQGSLF